jgi:hypothetical protein
MHRSLKSTNNRRTGSGSEILSILDDAEEWVENPKLVKMDETPSQYLEGITDKGEITLPKPKPPGFTRRTTHVYS